MVAGPADSSELVLSATPVPLRRARKPWGLGEVDSLSVRYSSELVARLKPLVSLNGALKEANPVKAMPVGTPFRKMLVTSLSAATVVLICRVLGRKPAREKAVR